MKKSFLLIVLSLALYAVANSQVVQTLNLKNGSVLHGFMKAQRPGNNCVFASEYATIIVEGSAIKEIKSEKVAYGELSDEWKHWAESNDALYGVGEGREMTLCTLVENNGKKIEEVYVLEKGQAVKYVEFTKRDYALAWDEIASIEYDRRPNALLSGINRSFVVKNGNVVKVAVGQCLKEIPDGTIYLLEADGVVESFNMNDVVKDNSIKNNPNQSLFEQSPLLDEIVMKDGSQHLGIVTERNYESELNYFLLTSENNGVEYTTSIKMNDVAEFHKLSNSDYEPLQDILLKAGDIVVNREEVTMVELVEKESAYDILPEMEKNKITQGEDSLNLVIEANFEDAKEVQDWLFIKARKVEKDKKRINHYEFDYADMVKNVIAPSAMMTSMNNTTKMSYKLIGDGLYVFFNKKSGKAVLVEL